jgi:hypothetical protein
MSTEDGLFVIVLNVTAPFASMVEMAAKAAAGLLGRLNPQTAPVVDFIDQDGTIHHRIANIPMGVRAAENSEQIRLIRRAAMTAYGVLVTDFATSMNRAEVNGNGISVLGREKSLEYQALCLYGPSLTVLELTSALGSWTLLIPPWTSTRMPNWP